MLGVKYVQQSGNSKLSGKNKLDATYVSLSTCPEYCSLRNECYAKLSFVGMHVKKLNEESLNIPLINIARAEANAIDQSYNGGAVPNVDLRLRVSGDCRTIRGTKIINDACGRWLERGGKTIFSYTHAWDKILREQWSNVSMLASVDNIDQVEYARQNGYAPALVVSEHINNKAYYIEGCDTKWIPCLSQTKGKSCSECRLCMKADWLYENNMGVAFSAHGVKKQSLKKRLKVLQNL